MPISPPKPNSPPSANCVEALWSTMALSTSRRNRVRRGRVFGDDAFGVLRAVVRDVIDGVVNAVDDAHREDRRQILRAPIVLACGLHRERSRARRRRRAVRSLRHATHRAIRGSSIWRDCAVDQQRFRRAADRNAPHLGVHAQSRWLCPDRRRHERRCGRCPRDARTPARAPRPARAQPSSCRRAARSRRSRRSSPRASCRPRRGQRFIARPSRPAEKRATRRARRVP